MRLPVKDINKVLPFYENKMQFILMPNSDLPNKIAILFKPHIEIGLIENGAEPSEDGCFIKVNSVEKAMKYFKSRGFNQELTEILNKKEKNTEWKYFNLLTPDGLKFWFVEDFHINAV